MTKHTKPGPILVPLDGSDIASIAVTYAQAVATPDQEIILLAVLTEAEAMRDLWGNVIASPDEQFELEQTATLAMLSAIADSFASAKTMQPQLVVERGDPAEEIMAAASRLHAAMIVMASRGRGALGRVAFGSVADRITRNSTVPVMVIHPPEGDARGEVTIARMVVPIDGSELSQEALPVAIALAQATGTTIHIVQAIPPPVVGVASPEGMAVFPADLFQDIEKEMARAAESSVAGVTGLVEAAGVTVTHALVNGVVTAAIQSELLPGDVIVMTSHGRGGFTRWLLGSVSEKLVRSGLAPVVLVPTTTRIDATKQAH